MYFQGLAPNKHLLTKRLEEGQLAEQCTKPRALAQKPLRELEGGGHNARATNFQGKEVL